MREGHPALTVTMLLHWTGHWRRSSTLVRRKGSACAASSLGPWEAHRGPRLCHACSLMGTGDCDPDAGLPALPKQAYQILRRGGVPEDNIIIMMQVAAASRLSSLYLRSALLIYISGLN